MVFDQIEPFGSIADDIRAALICRTIASCFVKRDDGEPFTIDDFRLNWTGERQPKQKSPEDLLLQARFMNDFYAGMNKAKEEQEHAHG